MATIRTSKTFLLLNSKLKLYRLSTFVARWLLIPIFSREQLVASRQFLTQALLYGGFGFCKR